MEIYKNLDINDLDGELWKQIENFQDYEVSNLGRIKSFKKWNGTDCRILKQRQNNRGYLFVKLYKNRKKERKQIHILLFETFNDYKLKENEVIHHLNKNKLDNIIINLQKMNKSEHSGLHTSGENHPMFGKYHSDKTKKIMREKKSGENHPMFGKKRPEHSKKMLGKNNPNFGKGISNQKRINIEIDVKKGIYTQSQMAKKHGVSRKTISNIKIKSILK